jgi:membrane-bound lytic murein transglycosylase B
MNNLIYVLLPCFLTIFPAQAEILPGVPEFIDEMVSKHQFKRDELHKVLNRAKHKKSIIRAISRPATIKPWLEYRAIFVNKKRIQQGLIFWRKHQATLQRAEKQYGVPQEIIVSIIGVETMYGKRAGTYRAIDALTTLAFDYPRRAKFFRSELENLLLLVRDQQFDLLKLKGSYAGALGIPQFMPSSYRNYAVDFNGNQVADLLNEPEDAIGSVGNYLQGYGWLRDEPVSVLTHGDHKNLVRSPPQSISAWKQIGIHPKSGTLKQDKMARLLDYTVKDGKEFWLAFNNFEVITRYNNSDFYAMSVFQLATKLKAKYDAR